MLTESRTVTIPYGLGKSFVCEVDASRIIETPAQPEPLTDVAGEVRKALRSPIDFPSLSRAVIPNDRVVLALDRETPAADELLAGIWTVLESAGVKPGNVIVLEPTPSVFMDVIAARTLPHPEMTQMVHTPVVDTDCGYLASSMNGERIYLAKPLLEAEVVISIGCIGFDPVMGYRGTNSVYFPGLSTPTAQAKALGQGHQELGPDDDRPYRQLVDEVAWLLGTQFSIQVAPSLKGGAAQVFAGLHDSVFRRGKEYVQEHWLIELDYRAEMVIVGVDEDAGGHGWSQIGAAIATARNLVSKGGRIVVLSDVYDVPGDGMQLLTRYDNPSDSLRSLREAAPEDLRSATELVSAVDWADVYLLSQLESDLVEDLFMLPLESEAEVTRLIERDEPILFLPSAQHMFGRISH